MVENISEDCIIGPQMLSTPENARRLLLELGLTPENAYKLTDNRELFEFFIKVLERSLDEVKTGRP